MRKIKLDPEEIRVATFDTEQVPEDGTGTVRGQMTYPNTDFVGCTVGSTCSSPHNCREDEER
jgi:hypothetical protein